MLSPALSCLQTLTEVLPPCGGCSEVPRLPQTWGTVHHPLPTVGTRGGCSTVPTASTVPAPGLTSIPQSRSGPVTLAAQVCHRQWGPGGDTTQGCGAAGGDWQCGIWSPLQDTVPGTCQGTGMSCSLAQHHTNPVESRAALPRHQRCCPEATPFCDPCNYSSPIFLHIFF